MCAIRNSHVSAFLNVHVRGNGLQCPLFGGVHLSKVSARTGLTVSAFHLYKVSLHRQCNIDFLFACCAL